MSIPAFPYVRTLVVVAALSVLLAACGRRGPLEPPPDASAPKQTDSGQKQGDTDEESEDTAAPTPGLGPTSLTGTRKRPKGYTIPKEPFVLDKIL